MSEMKLLAVILAATVCLPVYAQRVSAQANSAASPERVELPAEFDAILRAYEEGWRRRDAQSIAALFAENGFVLRPGQPPVRGRRRIQDAYAGSGGPLVLRAYDYAMDGSVGFIIGGFARTTEDSDVGKFVLTLRKDASDRWLIAADMDNGNSR